MQFLNNSGVVTQYNTVIVNTHLGATIITNTGLIIAVLEHSENGKDWTTLTNIPPNQSITVSFTKPYLRLMSNTSLYLQLDSQNNFYHPTHQLVTQPDFSQYLQKTDLQFQLESLLGFNLATVTQVITNILKNSDTDFDGLTDFDETVLHKTNPNNPDSDNDGVMDSVEISQNTNPNDPDSKIILNLTHIKAVVEDSTLKLYPMSGEHYFPSTSSIKVNYRPASLLASQDEKGYVYLVYPFSAYSKDDLTISFQDTSIVQQLQVVKIDNQIHYTLNNENRDGFNNSFADILRDYIKIEHNRIYHSLILDRNTEYSLIIDTERATETFPLSSTSNLIQSSNYIDVYLYDSVLDKRYFIKAIP